MKRKAAIESQSQSPGPISAIAARRSKQKLAEVERSPVLRSPSPVNKEGPPLKRVKASALSKRSDKTAPRELNFEEITEDAENEDTVSEDSSLGDGSNVDDNSSESQTEISRDWEDFLLSKTRLSKRDIAFHTKEALGVRLRMKATLVLVGQYDLWVKRGVVSIFGAKLHPSPRLHRVYAPSTHSLPVIKCVSGGPDDYAEIEIRSCYTGLVGLGDISNLYDRIWNGEQTVPKRELKCDGHASFAVLYSTSDDQLGRPIRPLHNAKNWGLAMKTLSQRGGDLRVLTCGPKGSGKSTFNKYLLNHLLSAPPSREMNHPGKDGVAFLDLDPGQPEFAPAGHIYLGHIRSPVFGPPYSHPTLNAQSEGCVLRSHHIGATSPKDDSDHYAIAIMDLMDHFHQLRHQYPQCPLIINYPGWIFGQGLEIVTWLVSTLGLSDVVYMSEKGPEEVVVPLEAAASQAGVQLTVLPSQPIEYACRSSSQLRSMQMLSYFHSSQVQESLIWSNLPLIRSRSLVVNYSGDKQGVFGIMAPGFPREPDLLYDLLDGAIVGVVALESVDAINGPAALQVYEGVDGSTSNPGSPEPEYGGSTHKGDQNNQPIIVRTKEQLPYLFLGSGGTCIPPDPKLSRSLGLAIVKSINTEAETLELITPIPFSTIRHALDQNHRIVLIRGHLDNPNWAISEEYFAARAAQSRYRAFIVQRSLEKKENREATETQKQKQKPKQQRRAKEKTESLDDISVVDAHDGGMVDKLRDRVRLAAHVPWMRVEGWDEPEKKTRRKRLWKVRRRADMVDLGVESEDV
ncbi:hypothetical protein VTO42DRAFT_949 [Malbranchea cinnamomea]